MRTAPTPWVPRRGVPAAAPSALCTLAVVGLTVCALLLPGHPASAADDVSGDPVGELMLRQALALALVRSPELQSVSLEVRAREARALQAGSRPNPQLHAEVENAGGSGARRGFEQTETTVRLSQLMELGGKRRKRERVAELATALATWDYEARRLHALSETSRAFVQVLSAQERVVLAHDLARLADEAVRAVSVHVAAGGAPALEATRATVAFERASLESRRIEQELVVARSALAATWGSTSPTFSRVRGDLTTLDPPPPVDDLIGRLAATPEVARWETEIAEREAALAVARAERVPDVTVGAGGRHFSDNGDNAVVLELSLPLPVFDRNAGAIAEAEHRLAKARADREAATVAVHAALRTAVAQLRAAHERALHLRSRVLPQAQAALDGALDAYRKGLFRVVDVLDAQRTLFELRVEYLASLETYHVLVAEVERLTAAPLTTATDTDGDTR